ncbi:DoxX family protein [Hymenobacter sp. BT175]|uniref:DoxX family protein n=1 Tax=Hymenobacter translucens TaxID=2886507 RepID=UPI001D0ED552|nr:DoxX family protein [Hymenobacter translucens]MCC2545002.1 DoxX family protein [Hymenobacter translucens]
MALFENHYRTTDAGLLILRIGIGIMFTLHGYPKLMGGVEVWEQVGSVMKQFGLDFAPTVWGFLAAFAEAVGGQLLALGMLFRVACALLLITMLVALASHVVQGDDFTSYSHSLESAILFLSLLFIGPGRYALDQALFPTRRRLF